jgi:hypothetical protein
MLREKTCGSMEEEPEGGGDQYIILGLAAVSAGKFLLRPL